MAGIFSQKGGRHNDNKQAYPATALVMMMAARDNGIDNYR